jgi:uncharacterized protein
VSKPTYNKRKIVNDPVHGFISIPTELIYDIIEHPYFQRLRRIKQLGLTHYVYPGATHTRFQHALGALYLMQQAIQVIRNKGHLISPEEAEGVMIAILLHDIGHGPFSHALETSIIEGFNHEELSVFLMKKLNTEFEGKLDLALQIFQREYHKDFLHQLVSSQLDIDRLDYLKRDSFYTGVTEGVIGSDRIIKMFNVVNDKLVIEAKGIYSIEKFLIARRLMYWQVYLHKAVLASENLLVKTLTRAKELAQSGTEVFATPSLAYFLKKQYTASNGLIDKDELVSRFIQLDDNDIMTSAKEWMNHPDKVLSILSGNLVNRVLPRVYIREIPYAKGDLEQYRNKVKDTFGISLKDVNYLVYSNKISNHTYSENDDKIEILFNNNQLLDIAEASEILKVSSYYKLVEKYYLCIPKDCDD